MNMRIEKPAAILAWSARPGRRLLQAAVAPVARAVAALSFDLDGQGPQGGRLGGEIGGQALPRPVVSTRLPLRRGGHRHVLLMGQSAERLARTPCRLTLDGSAVAGIDPDWLQSPLVDLAALVEGLTEEGQRRLLKLTLTTGASLFGSGCTSGYGDAIRRLLRLLAVPEIAPVSVCALGAAGRVLSYRLPAGGTPALGSLTALTENRVTRIGGFSLRTETHPRGALLHLHAPAVPEEGVLIGLGPSALALRASGEARPLAPWLARRSEAVRTWIADVLDAAAPDATTDALLREARSVEAPAPEVTVGHLSATASGVLLVADVRDPNDLLTALRIELGDAAQDLGLDGSAGARIGGFLNFTEARPGASCRLKLVYRSGRIQAACDMRLTAYDGSIPEGFRMLPPALAANAVAAARLSLPRQDPFLRLETIGAPPRRARLSLVVAAGAPDLIRARAALLACEPEAKRVEIVYHARAAESEVVRRTLEGVHAVFGLTCHLVTLPNDASSAERLRAALGVAQGPALVLGGEAMPADAGWLATWTKALRGRRAPLILGGMLLGPDGSIADAGAQLRVGNGATRIERRWAGLPASALPQQAPSAVDIVGADCVGLNRAALAAFCASEQGHPSAEVRLFDLAQRFRRGRILVQGRFIRFSEGCAPDTLGEAADAQAMTALRLASKGGA